MGIVGDMFKLSLMLQRNNDDELLLRLPIGFRLMFAVIVTFLLGSMIGTGGVSAGSIILTVLSILAGLYKEQWRFNREEGAIEHRSGLLFPYITRQFSFDDIDHFVLSRSKSYRPAVARGHRDGFNQTAGSQRRGTSMTSFGLITKEGKARTIEIRKSRNTETMEGNVQEISSFCEIPVKFQE